MLRVVVVDDHHGLRDLASAMFADLGPVVATFATADEALAYGGWHLVDLAIVDWVLPGGAGGGAVLRHLDEHHPDVWRVVLTAYPLESVPAGVADVVIDKANLDNVELRLSALDGRTRGAARE